MGESPFISTIIDFFRQGLSPGDELSLVKLLWHFDFKQRTLPSADEINKAIELYQNVSVRREGGDVFFVGAVREGGGAGDITAAELKRANKQYKNEFRALLNK